MYYTPKGVHTIEGKSSEATACINTCAKEEHHTKSIDSAVVESVKDFKGRLQEQLWLKYEPWEELLQVF